MLTSVGARPPRGQGRAGGGPERRQPEGSAQGEAAQAKPAPEPLERLHPAEGRLHLGHARQPIERLDERLELIGRRASAPG